MKKFSKITIAAMIFLFGAVLLLRPADAAAWVRDGLSLCARAVVPSLFPFFVASSLVVECGIARSLGRIAAPLMKPLFGVSGSGAAALIAGLLGGYPSGARTAAELYERGELSLRDANRLLLFCNNAGPSFIVGYCGTVLGGTSVGMKLYAIHAISALFIGIAAGRIYVSQKRRSTVRHSAGLAAWSADTTQMSRHGKSDSKSAARDKGFADALTASIKNALTAILSVCAFVTFFCVLTSMLDAFGVLPALAATIGGEPSFFRGLIEMIGGIAALGATQPTPQTCAAAAILGFGGLCVLCQTFAVTGHSGLSRRRAVVGKLLHGGAAFLLALIVF